MNEILQMQSLTDKERLVFLSEMNSRRKDPTTGVLLCLFTGGVGGHHFHLGRTGLGIAYLATFWTFIPMLIAVIELFLMTGRVRKYNAEVAHEIATTLKALRSGADGESGLLAANAQKQQPKGGTVKTAALGAAGGAVAGLAAASLSEDEQGAEATEVVGEEGGGVASTLADLLGDE